MIGIGLLSLVTATSALPAAIDPLGPARHGEAQCYAPDRTRKTCRSLAYYDARATSSYDNRAIVLVSTEGPVTLETITPVVVRAGAVCGAIRVNDIQSGKLIVSGRQLTVDEARPLLGRLAEAMTPIIDKEICTTYVPKDGALVAHATVDGTPRPDMDQLVEWVKPSDGYIVGP
jgi:hypothetical protein